MGFLDALLGRTKAAQPNLDRLFGLPGARITLEASEGLVPTGQAGVCFKPSAGQAFSDTEKEINDLLSLGDPTAPPDGAKSTLTLSEQLDSFGYRWVLVSAEDFDTLVTRVHIVNTSLQDAGYGPQLLCSVFSFTAGASENASGGIPHAFLVYLYKRGSFYPFVPTGPERRDGEAELRLRSELGDDLHIETDLDRWFPLWELPLH